MTAYVPEDFTSDGGRHPAALLHEPRRPGVRPGQPARGRQRRPVRPLQPQPEEPPPAVPRRVRRRSRHLGRPLDRRHRRPAARRGALREGVRRVRRRLGRPARRRPPRLRAGLEPPDQGARVGPADELPRAEHPLHRLRRPARRALPLLPGPGSCSAQPLGTRYVGDMDRLFDAYAGAGRSRHRPRPGHDGQAALRLATSSTARRRGPRRSTPCAACCRRRRSPTSASTARGQAFEALLLRMRPHPLPGGPRTTPS